MKTRKVSDKQNSKNYDWFKFLSNNRKISERHIKELEKEFDRDGNITEVSPITVNKHGFIMDGQHRFLICQKRELPVFYIEVDARKELTPAMNSKQKAWSAMDYVEFYAAYKQEYELLRRFIRDNDITYPLASAVIFAGENRRFASNRRLKDGTLEVKELLPLAQKHLDIVLEIGEKVGAEIFEPYARGIVRMLESESFDIARFNKKLDSVMKNSPTLPNLRLRAQEDVMRNIEMIYNFMAGDKSRVRLY